MNSEKPAEKESESLIRSLRPCRVAVVGDVMLDRYVKGSVNRLSPEAPIQILEVRDEYQAPGGAANVAMKAVELGSSVQIVGLVGDDATGRELRELLATHPQLTDRLVVDSGRRTTEKTRFVAHNQQLLRVDRERRDRLSDAAIAELAAAARAACANADAVILEDYGKGVLTPEVIQAALDGAKQSGVPVVVDPNGRDYQRYAGSTVITPNVKEAELAAQQSITGPESLQSVGKKLVELTGAALALTRDADGISLFEKDASAGVSHMHIPTVPVAVYDVTGAGDAVAASLAIGLACGLRMRDACTVANMAGRAIVRQFGVGVLSISHLLREAHSETAESKTVDAAYARQRAREVQKAGGKVVFTNGCFDILHYGHAYLLQFARQQGDLLILGLNSDASVSRNKGASRPLVPEDQRAYMLSLYRFIDLIVFFDEDTPMNLIEAIRPDVLVKGGDYSPETVVGRELVESHGGKVTICPRLEGLSTTDIVRKIRDER